MPITKQDDAQAFFRFLLKRENSAVTLLADFLEFHGGLNHGQMMRMVEVLRELLAREYDDPEDLPAYRDVVAPGFQITSEVIRKYAPSLMGEYFARGRLDDFDRVEVFSAAPNPYMTQGFPAFANLRLKRENRPGLNIFVAQGRKLFVSTYGFQYFDAEEKIFWLEASSRVFAKSILKYPEVVVDRPVVVVQDRNDAGNFAHFLYDCVPRILYFIRFFPEEAKRAVFILGGKKASYHTFVLAFISKKYGVDYGNFVYPEDHKILRISQNFYFFSDHGEMVAHPLNMCAQETVELVRNLIPRSMIDTDVPEKIYISREDAQRRRIANEDALLRALKKRGYCKVVMKNLGAQDQISLLASARDVVGPHGMGMTNILFNTNPSGLLELFSPTFGSDAYAFVSKALGLEYKYLVGTAVDGAKPGDYEVDIDQVMGALRN